jgi:hypothetical protein
VAAILTVPLVAMQFTDEVVWTVWDFVVVGILLATIGITIEFAVKKAGNRRMAVGIAALGVLSILWGADGDAPGLVLLGLLLIVSGGALGVRTTQRSG